MSDYYAGLGTHAGSVWLARTLNIPRLGVWVQNERVNRGTKGHWMHILKRQVDAGRLDPYDPFFERYFEYIGEFLEKYRIVCDFNSFAPCFLPDIHERLPIKRIIGLMRNGILQLYSLVNSYIWSRVTEDHWLVDDFLRFMWEFGGKAGKPFDKRTFWEKRCIQWTCMVYQYEALEKRGFNIDVYRLEDLTTDTNVLRSVIHSLTPERTCSDEELLERQKQDENRKIRGKRTPELLWDRWTEEQQQGFIEICGEGMERYGYEIPERKINV